jgi:hypothetical protein
MGMYVGDPDFHDGQVVTVARSGSDLQVEVRGASGRAYEVVFSGVESVTQRRPEGMLLYALTEMPSEPPLRRFVFANWDEQDEATLEVDALDFRCTPVAL